MSTMRTSFPSTTTPFEPWPTTPRKFRLQRKNSDTRMRNLASLGRRGRNAVNTGNTVADDPFTDFLRPPAGETEEERLQRMTIEAEAKKRSEEIDKALKEEASRAKVERSAEKTILLLGQAEAGKTTIVKQMRMLYAPERQAQVRSAWTDVVYLNVILAVKKLVGAYQDTMGNPVTEKPATLASSTRHAGAVSASPLLSCLSMPAPHGQCDDMASSVAATNKTLLSRFRLAPLLSMEVELRRRLGAFEEAPMQKEASIRRSASSHFEGSSRVGAEMESTLQLKAGWQDMLLEPIANNKGRSKKDIGVDPLAITQVKWGLPGRRSRKSSDARRHSTKVMQDEPTQRGLDDLACCHTRDTLIPSDHGKMQRLLEACAPEVQNLVNGLRKIKSCEASRFFETDSATYFLNNIERFARPGYCPTDDDILRARVRTVGVYEEVFAVNKQMSYRIIDVGGSRCQRNVWAQFFSDATAIIFLAPISAFNERLQEDPSVNKVTDSLQIWDQVTSSPLLQRVSLILFLNKIDVLQSKLRAGVGVKNYFPQYDKGDKFEDVWRYFRSLFLTIAKNHQAEAPSRNLYVHKTTATSTREIQAILTSCQDIILRQHLKESALT